MGNRLLPFRQYNEHDVINMYALDDAYVNESIVGYGSGDAGVFVKVTAANLDLDPVTYGSNSYLGKTDYPFVGSQDMYPTVTLKIAPTTGINERPLGIALMETAKYDENGQKLLYYPQKAQELQVSLPGKSIPVATRGVFTVTSRAFDGTLSVGQGFAISNGGNGKITGVNVYNTGLLGVAGNPVLGTVLATGSRGANGATITDKYSGTYAVIKLGL